MNKPVVKKQFRHRRIARGKTKIEEIRKKASIRNSGFFNKRNSLLKNLDKSVFGFKKICELLLKKEVQENKVASKEFIKSVKKTLLENLKFLRLNADKLRFDELQMRSILIFENKLNNANTLSQLNLALEYFSSKSCILKVKK